MGLKPKVEKITQYRVIPQACPRDALVFREFFHLFPAYVTA